MMSPVDREFLMRVCTEGAAQGFSAAAIVKARQRLNEEVEQIASFNYGDPWAKGGSAGSTAKARKQTSRPSRPNRGSGTSQSSSKRSPQPHSKQRPRPRA